MEVTMNTQTANDLYIERKREINEQIKTLRRLLTKHASEQKQRKGDYGFASDLGRVAEHLANAIASLRGDE